MGLDKETVEQLAASRGQHVVYCIVDGKQRWLLCHHTEGTLEELVESLSTDSYEKFQDGKFRVFSGQGRGNRLHGGVIYKWSDFVPVIFYTK